jgi:hypothetical protein
MCSSGATKMLHEQAPASGSTGQEVLHSSSPASPHANTHNSKPTVSDTLCCGVKRHVRAHLLHVPCLSNSRTEGSAGRGQPHLDNMGNWHNGQ